MFTGANGVLTNVFYPTLDTSDFTDQQFIVGDAAHTWDQTEKTDATHSVALFNGNSLAWTVTNTGSNGKWRITKTIYTDPNRPVVDEKVTFTALSGTLGGYTLYELSNPSQENNGNNDTGQTVTFNGRQMLVDTGATSNASALAVGNGIGWLTQGGTTMLSSGFVGTNDGWQDLLGGTSPDHTMTNAYSSATNGNIAQLGQFDLSPVASQTSVSFDLAIGMGATASAAESSVDGELTTLAGNETGVLTSYVNQWSSWLAGLDTYGGLGGEQFLVSAMGLKASQDPISGAIVAGIGHPWGDSFSTADPSYSQQLVDLGILPANDPRVANTIAVTANPNTNENAGSLAELLPNGLDFFRYNHDGYGEPASGANWTGVGVGRLWPILDGEYGQYQYSLGRKVAPYVTDLQHYASPAGLLSEQVWDNAPPAGNTPGTPTLSMSALNWSLSMYIQLVAASFDQQHGIAGLPGTATAVFNHYAGAAKPAVTTSVSPPVAGQPAIVRYAGSLAASATAITLHWGHDGWQNVTDTPMVKQADGSWTATVTVPAGTGLNTAFQNQAGTWDNNGGADYNLAAVNSPVSASTTPLTTGATTIRYAGSLAATATAITLHWGHDGWQGVTDTR